MDIVMISTLTRPELLYQSLLSIKSNSVGAGHPITLVIDKNETSEQYCYSKIEPLLVYAAQTISTYKIGASRARNIGASSIPKYRRQQHIMFLDDDVYLVPGWDRKLEDMMGAMPGLIASGHAHPYNQFGASYWLMSAEGKSVAVSSTSVISSVHMAMSWSVWDDVGYFVEPGGPGGSEDVDWCRRAVDKGYGLAVSNPQTVLHTGLVNSSGQAIVGVNLVSENNKKLIDLHKLDGKVVFG